MIIINILLFFLVSCNGNDKDWKFNHSKLENHQGYIKSNDIINLKIKKEENRHNDNVSVEFLRSHDIQFTIGNDTFQEVVCHNERLGGNDEVSKLTLFISCKYLTNFTFFFTLVVHRTY